VLTDQGWNNPLPLDLRLDDSHHFLIPTKVALSSLSPISPCLCRETDITETLTNENQAFEDFGQPRIVPPRPDGSEGVTRQSVVLGDEKGMWAW
jgi:hypothetical protein